MAVKVGYVSGTCSNCGKELSAPKPADLFVCDCWEYCPRDHGKGAYGTKMEPYTPDLTPDRYGPIKTVSGDAHGDLKHPTNILMRCSICNYHSSLKPVEVELG